MTPDTQTTLAARWEAAKAKAGVGILTGQQSGLVEEIKTYHAGVRKSFEHQVQYAFMAGLKLVELKSTCDHGNKKDDDGRHASGFMAIREQFLPDISRSAATRYMDYFALLSEKLPTVGNIRSSNLLLENGELPQKEKEKVLAAVYEAADGKSWTAFYRDLGMVREKKPQQHHPRKELSPDEHLAARKQAAVEAMKRLLGDLAIMRLEHWTDLSKTDQQQVLDELIDFNHFAKSAAKAPKK